MDITVKAIDLFSVLNALFYLNPRPGYCDGTWLVIHKQNGEVFFTTENQQGRFSIKLKTVSISGSTGISLPYLPLFHALRTIADDTIVRMLWPETGKATFCKILFSGISIKIHAKNPSILKTEEKQLDRWPVLPDTACFRKIETILPFVSRDEFRTAMRGVFVEEDGFVATNGAVLAKLPARTGLDKILLPMFAVRILLNIPHFPAETRFRTGHKSGNMYITMMSRSFYFNFFLSPDRFPEYKRLFPRDYTTKFICFRKDLLEKIAVLQALQINFTDKLVFNIEKNIKITSTDDQIPVEAVTGIEPVHVEGENLTIGLSANYIIKILNSFTAEKVKVELNTGMSPTMWTEEPGDVGNYRILMPINLKKD